MQESQSIFNNTKFIVIFIVVIIVACGIYFEYSKPNEDTFSGYVVYESPATGQPLYNFFILGTTDTAVGGDLSTMAGFPSVDDPNFKYISDQNFKGTLPNVGDKVSVQVVTNNNVETNPPASFAMTAKSINVVLDAQFNATVTGLMQAIK